MKAWIEPNDDPTYMMRIDIYEDNVLERSINYIHRPLQWHIEDIEPIDYSE